MKNIINILENYPNWWKRDLTSNNYKFVYSFNTSFDGFQNVLQSFKESWQINKATGNDLDKIANRYGLIRTKFDTDESLRSKIKSYLTILSGKGTIPDLQNILSFYTGLETTDITIEELREMVLSLSIAIDVDTDESTLVNVVDIIPDIKTAGVYIVGPEYSSKDNIFLSNLSTSNGEDKIL